MATDLPLRLTRSSGVYLVVVVLSSAFTHRLRDLVGGEVVGTVLTVLGAIIGGALLIYAWRKQALLPTALLVAVAVYAASSLSITTERVHILTSGLFGFLVYREHSHLPLRLRYLATVLLGTVLVVAEESFQFFLPGRVADMRDVMIGIVSAVGGGMLSSALLGEWQGREKPAP